MSTAQEWKTYNIFKLIAVDNACFIGMSKSEPRKYINNIKKRGSGMRVARHMSTVGWEGSRTEMIEKFVCLNADDARLRHAYWIKQSGACLNESGPPGR
jgi:hypothetical protein